MQQSILLQDLQLIEYARAWDFQEQLLQKNLFQKAEISRMIREGGAVPAEIPTTHYLLFCEHPPVFTLGKSGKMEHVLLDEAERAEKGIAFYPTNRGGDITFHGPGQLVGYPILDLEKFYTDIGKYLRNLEEVIILTMAEYGLKGERSPGETGVWLDPFVKGRERKICAMGVRCSRWITMHGFAFNINTDLSYFDAIIPCGIKDKQVTSLARELGHTVPLDEVKGKVRKNFEKVFDCQIFTDGLLV
jgi:lipoyl(octanoyl) transferase